LLPGRDSVWGPKPEAREGSNSRESGSLVRVTDWALEQEPGGERTTSGVERAAPVAID